VRGAAAVLLIERVLPSQLPAQTVLGIVFILFVVFARQGIAGALRGVVRV
jgi:ABC-type branched-subunit amino acid transport system permease subunit